MIPGGLGPSGPLYRQRGYWFPKFRIAPQSGQVQVMLLQVIPQRFSCIQPLHIMKPQGQSQQKETVSPQATQLYSLRRRLRLFALGSRAMAPPGKSFHPTPSSNPLGRQVPKARWLSVYALRGSLSRSNRFPGDRLHVAGHRPGVAGRGQLPGSKSGSHATRRPRRASLANSRSLHLMV